MYETTKQTVIYRKSSYQEAQSQKPDIKNIKPQNCIDPLRLKSHFGPTTMRAYNVALPIQGQKCCCQEKNPKAFSATIIIASVGPTGLK